MRQASPAGRPSPVLDLLIPALLAAILPLACLVLARDRPMWTDELLSRVMLADPSFEHMLAALADTINAFPPLYFVVGWGWARLFGSGELSLRMLSSLPMAAGVFLAWRTLRMVNSRTAASLAVVLLMATSRDLFHQNTEARPYGLYFLGFAAASHALWGVAARGAIVRGRAGYLALSTATLVATHYVGVFLSAALVATALSAWWLSRNRLWGVAAAWMATGWLAALAGVPFFLAQSSLGGESNWLTLADTSHLHDAFRCRLWGLDAIVALWVAGMLLLIGARGDARSADDADRPPTPAGNLRLARGLYVFWLFAAVPGLWIFSRVGPVIFLERYFFPLSLAWAVCAAAAIDGLLDLARTRAIDGTLSTFARRCLAAVAPVCLASMLAVAALAAREQIAGEVRGRRAEIDRVRACLAATGETRFLCGNLGVFLPIMEYERDLPCDFVIPPREARGIPQGFRGAATGLRRHYWRDRVLSLEEAETKLDRFAALGEDFEMWRDWGAFENWRVARRLDDSFTVVVERKDSP